MKFINKLTSGLVGLTLLFSPSVRAETYEEHRVLIDSLEKIGVEFVLNHPDLCDPEAGVSGLYSPTHNVLIVCQDYRSSFSSKEVEWTANDYDTLRHEAHHVVQDCMVGLENGNMGSYFDDSDTYTEFVTGALTDQEIDNIVETYREGGGTDEVVIHELEAFAVANSIPPDSIARALLRVCN